MVSRYERGENVPPVPTLDTLATILVVSVDYLLSREGAVPPEEQQP